MNVEEKLENEYWACQSLTISQLRMFEFRSTLMPWNVQSILLKYRLAPHLLLGHDY